MSRPMTTVERTIALRNVEAFSAVPIDQLAFVAATAREQELGEGQSLFAEGDPPGGLYVILSGEIALDREGHSIGSVGAGEALGTWSLFEDHPRRATARAVSDTRLLVVDRDDFYDVLTEHVEIIRSLVQDLVRKLMLLTVHEGQDER